MKSASSCLLFFCISSFFFCICIRQFLVDPLYDNHAPALVLCVSSGLFVRALFSQDKLPPIFCCVRFVHQQCLLMEFHPCRLFSSSSPPFSLCQSKSEDPVFSLLLGPRFFYWIILEAASPSFWATGATRLPILLPSSPSRSSRLSFWAASKLSWRALYSPS